MWTGLVFISGCGASQPMRRSRFIFVVMPVSHVRGGEDGIQEIRTLDSFESAILVTIVTGNYKR